MAREISPGSTFGSYRIDRVLGRGGMGVVYEAQDARGQKVALKVVSRDLAANPSFMARFRREGRVAIDHRNVVALLGSGDENGTPYLVFELVPGGTLHERLKERGRLEWRDAARIAAGIARGLSAVHEAGLVHRDLKPANVLLDEGGEPKLADFGIVGGHTTSLAVSQALTKTGEVVGTLEFISPEQADARRENLTPRSDLYTLGAVIFCLLTGRPPFEGAGYMLLTKHLSEQPRPPSQLAPDVPRSLDELVLRLLAKDPEARPRSAAQVARELEAIAEEAPARRGPPLAVVLAGAAVLVVLGAAGSIVVFGSHEEAQPEATKAPTPTPDPGAASKEAARLAKAASAAIEAGKYDEALASATKAVSLDPKLAAAWAARGSARAWKGETRAGIADFDRALELEPRSTEFLKNRATLHESAGDRAAALADLDHALAIDPKDAEARVDHAILLERKGDSRGAMDEVTRAIELDARSKKCWITRATMREELRDFDGASSDLDKALDLDAKDPVIRIERAILRANQGDRAAARAEIDKAIELGPKLPRAWTTRAELVTKKDPEQAHSDYSQALDLDPQNVTALKARGMLRSSRRDYAGAIADLSRATKLIPDDSATWSALAFARFASGDVAGSIPDSTRAIQLDPSSPGPFGTRGLARAQQKETAGAIEDLTRYLELAPPDTGGLEDIRKTIASLKEGR